MMQEDVPVPGRAGTPSPRVFTKRVRVPGWRDTLVSALQRCIDFIEPEKETAWRPRCSVPPGAEVPSAASGVRDSTVSALPTWEWGVLRVRPRAAFRAGGPSLSEAHGTAPPAALPGPLCFCRRRLWGPVWLLRVPHMPSSLRHVTKLATLELEPCDP